MIDLIFTLSEGHRAKLIPPRIAMPHFAICLIHLEAVSVIVKEVFYETKV